MNSMNKLSVLCYSAKLMKIKDKKGPFYYSNITFYSTSLPGVPPMKLIYYNGLR